METLWIVLGFGVIERCFFFHFLTVIYNMHSQEPDTELSELVETFEKLRPVQAPPPPPPPPPSPVRALPSLVDKIADYASLEMENLKKKQAKLQEGIETKTKELATMRETLLVVSGAIQGIQHVHTFISDQRSLS